MGLWLGMISKGLEDYNPKIQLNENYIEAGNKVGSERWGLTVDERKQIWTKLIEAEARAEAVAEKKHPIQNDVSMAQLKRHGKIRDQVQSELETKIAAEYNIQIGILNSIGLEGLKSGWPFPN